MEASVRYKSGKMTRGGIAEEKSLGHGLCAKPRGRSLFLVLGRAAKWEEVHNWGDGVWKDLLL